MLGLKKCSTRIAIIDSDCSDSPPPFPFPPPSSPPPPLPPLKEGFTARGGVVETLRRSNSLALPSPLRAADSFGCPHSRHRPSEIQCSTASNVVGTTQPLQHLRPHMLSPGSWTVQCMFFRERCQPYSKSPREE